MTEKIDINEALVTAASKGSNAQVKKLLAKGANINGHIGKYGETALMLAARNGHTDTVELLIQKGADIEVKDDDGITALQHATKKGLTEIARLLIDRGTDDEIVPGKSVQPGAKGPIPVPVYAAPEDERPVRKKDRSINKQNGARGSDLEDEAVKLLVGEVAGGAVRHLREDKPVSYGSFIEDVFQRTKRDIPNRMFANFSDSLEKHNKIPCLVLDDGVETWSVSRGGRFKSIYEKADVKLNRAPFYYSGNYLINCDFKTYVILHQDGFITLTPGEKTKTPSSWDWHFYDNVSLIEHPNNGNPVIILHKDGEISCALESDRDKNKKCIVSDYEVLFAYKIIERLWPYIKNTKVTKMGPMTVRQTSFPIDLFYFIDKKGIASISESGGEIQVDKSADVSNQP